MAPSSVGKRIASGRLLRYPFANSQPAGRTEISLALVIFDCDGVLVDSEVISPKILRSALGDIGFEVSLDYVYRNYVGRGIQTVLDDVLDKSGRSVPDDFPRDWECQVCDAFRRSLKPIPGILNVLDNLGVPFCVASSSSPDRMRVSLSVTGLAEHFEGRMFSSSSVAEGKPAPDLFLHAAKAMGADAPDCLVVEDSRSGVIAAGRAGMRVWRFLGGSHFRIKTPSPIPSEFTVERVFSDMAAFFDDAAAPRPPAPIRQEADQR